MSTRLFDPPDKHGRYPFAYRSAARTDVAETFRIERERLKAEARKKGKVAAATSDQERSRRPA